MLHARTFNHHHVKRDTHRRAWMMVMSTRRYNEDVHFVKNDLGFSQYPMTPGHELAGVVTAVGKNVTKLAVGDNVGVGCMVRAVQVELCWT